MRRRHGNRARFGRACSRALGALALLAMPGLAAAKDRNHDRIPDRWEKKPPPLPARSTRRARDQDRDHLRNRAEFLAGDDPRDRDTDDDGVMDGEENAGTIASFDEETGRLTINLFSDDTIAGSVNDETEIKCEDDEATRAAATRRSGTTSGEATTAQGEPATTTVTKRPATTTAARARTSGDDSGPADESTTRTVATTTAREATARPPRSSPAQSSRRPSSSSRTEPPPSRRSSWRRLVAVPGPDLASSQSRPTPTSTSSGGSSW